ncbi:unnamed protein product, partial [Polarella glacialis]
PAGSTVHWSPHEASLSRASLNALLGSQEGKLDVTEAMMKAATIGQKARMGEGWEPPGMVSRKIAALLTKSKPPGQALGGYAGQINFNQPAPEPKQQQQSQQQLSPARPLQSSSSAPSIRKKDRTQWASMLPLKKQVDGAFMAQGH